MSASEPIARATRNLIVVRAGDGSLHREWIAGPRRDRWLWLPKQAPELSPMDRLWRDLKRLVAANWQAKSIGDLATQAVRWVMKLTPRQARRKAGMSSPRFWLRHLVLTYGVLLGVVLKDKG